MSGILKQLRINGTALTVVLGLGVASALAGCSAKGPTAVDDGPCMPPEYSVSPAVARPGSEVVVSAPAATCNPRYGENARIQVTVTGAEGNVVLDTKGPMDDDGAFEFTFAIPQDMPPGTWEVTAIPADVDWCDNTGTSNRLKTTDDLDRTSCVIPIKLLQITR